MFAGIGIRLLIGLKTTEASITETLALDRLSLNTSRPRNTRNTLADVYPSRDKSMVERVAEEAQVSLGSRQHLPLS